MIPEVTIEHKPRGKDDQKPYVATVRGEGFTYHAEAPTPNEALLLVAAHWHARAHFR